MELGAVITRPDAVIAGAAPAKLRSRIAVLSFSVTVPESVGRPVAAIVRPLRLKMPPAPCRVWTVSSAMSPGVGVTAPPPVWT